MDELGFCVDSYGMLSVEMIELRESIMSLMKLISFMIKWGNFPSKKVHRLDQILGEKKRKQSFSKEKEISEISWRERERGKTEKRNQLRSSEGSPSGNFQFRRIDSLQ